ncbi:EF hand domain-containing protein, partial [Toxoplasma gondii p89]
MDTRLKPVRAREKRRSFFYDQLPPPSSGPSFQTGEDASSTPASRASTPSAAAAAAAAAEAAVHASEASSSSPRGRGSSCLSTSSALDGSSTLGSTKLLSFSPGSSGSAANSAYSGAAGVSLHPSRGSVGYDLGSRGAIASSASAAQAAAAAVASLQQEGGTGRERDSFRPSLRRVQSHSRLSIGAGEAALSGDRQWVGESGRRLARAALAATAAASLGSLRRGKESTLPGKRGGSAGSLLPVKEEDEEDERGRRCSEVESDNMKGSDDGHDPEDGAQFENQGQLGTDFMRNVPMVVGIPVYGVGTGVTLGSFLGLLLVGLFMTYLFTTWYAANILSVDLPLPASGLDATLHLRNCAVQFHPLPEEEKAAGRGSFVRMSAWLGFQEVPRHARSREQTLDDRTKPWKWRSSHDLMLLLRFSSYDPWFRCTVRFYLADDFVFKSLDILFFPADNYINLDANIPLVVKDRLSVDAFHAFIRFSSIEAKAISLSVIDGHLDFLLDGPASHYSNQPILVNSRTASVSLQSRSPLSVSLDADAAARSLLRASGHISVSTPPGLMRPSGTSHSGRRVNSDDASDRSYGKGDDSSFSSEASPTVRALLHPSDASTVFGGIMAIPIALDCEQCAFYATARTLQESPEETSMETWVGQVHSAQPHLIPYAEEKVSAALKWVESDPSAPWVINVEAAGLPEAAGVWRILSSNAYLSNVYWFVMLSGGMLRPRTLHLPLQIMGLFCRSVIDVDEDDRVADVITSAEDFLAESVSHYFTRKRQTGRTGRGLKWGLGWKNPSSEEDLTPAKAATDLIRAAFTGNADDSSRQQNPTRRLLAVPEEHDGEVNAEDGDRGEKAMKRTKKEATMTDTAGAGEVPSTGLASTSRDKYRYQLLQSRQKLYEQYYAAKKKNEERLWKAAVGASDPFAPPTKPPFSSKDDFDEEQTGDAHATGQPRQPGVEENGGKAEQGSQSGSASYQSLYRPTALPTVASSSLLDLDDAQRAFFQDASPAPVRMLLAKDSAYPGASVGPTKPLTMCINEVIEDTFLVLWNALHDTRSPSTLYVWSADYTGPEYLYSVLSDALVKTRVGVRDTWYFLVAILINLVATLVLAVLVVYAVYVHFLPRLKKQDRETVVLRDASHRLDHEISGSASSAESDSSWNLMVSRVYYPCHGLLLRWSAPEGLSPFVRLGVHIRPAEVAWAEASNDTATLLKCAKKELYVYLDASSVQTVHQLGLNQKELFLPIQHPGMVELDTAQSYKLDPAVKYRVRLVRFTNHGRALDQSRWSPEIILGGAMTFTDYPILVLKRLLPSSVSSLDIFLRKFTYVASHFSIPVTLTNIKLQLFDMPPEARAKRLGRLASGALRRIQRSAFIADASHTVQRWGSDVENAVETLSCDYIASAHFGYKAQVAKDIRSKTGRHVYSEVRFQGHPAVVAGDLLDSGDQRPYLELGAKNQHLRLLKDRIAHNTISFEVVAGTTGQVLAYGTIRFEDLYQIVRETVQNQRVQEERRDEGEGQEDKREGKTPGRFRIGLEYVDGGGPWGRLECTLDIENIRSYIRHFDKDDTTDQAFQRRRARLRTTIQSIKSCRVADEGENETRLSMSGGSGDSSSSQDRRRRLSRVEGTSEEILAKLGCLTGEGESRDGELSRPGLATGIELASSTPRDGKRNRRLSRLGVSIDTEGLQVPLLSAAESAAQAPTSTSSRLGSHLTRSRMSLFAGAGSGKESLPYFVSDSPGRPLLQGSDLFVQWLWPDAGGHPDHVFLGLFRHEDNRYISALHWGRPVPNTGSYAWSVDTMFERGQQCQLVYIAMFTSPLQPPYDAASAVCESNAFYIVRPTPLAELELIYASFCRTHGLEME